jgi:hypothetical protein
LASGSGRERLFSPRFRATSRRVRRDGSTRVLESWSTRSHSTRTGDEGHVEHAHARLISGARAAALIDLGKKLFLDGHAGTSGCTPWALTKTN